MPETKTRRSKAKYPALEPKYNLKIREDELKCDYLHQLSDDEKDWLNRFNEEYVNASFNHSGERVHPKEHKYKVVKKTGKRKRVDVYKQECETRNNNRNNDVLIVSKTNNMLKDEKKAIQQLESINYTTNETENLIIEQLDEFKKDRNV